MGDTDTLLRCRSKDSMSRSAGICTVVGEATFAGGAAGVRNQASRGLDTDKSRSDGYAVCGEATARGERNGAGPLDEVQSDESLELDELASSSEVGY